MSERTKLIKKAVLTGVGATQSVDRIKEALNDAMSDLVKVGQDLFDELEYKGKSKAESVQDFLRNFKSEAKSRTGELEKHVSSLVQTEVKRVAKDVGLTTREEIEELLDRIADLEETVGIANGEGSGENAGKRRRKKHSS